MSKYYRLEYPDGVGVFRKNTMQMYMESRAFRELLGSLYVPKIFEKDPGKTRSWFTEYGYQKNKNLIDEILLDVKKFSEDRGLRLLVTNNPGKIIMHGKVQIVTLEDDESFSAAQ